MAGWWIFPTRRSTQESERGGGGLYMSASNFVKVLADLVSPSPRILSSEMVDLLFSPQFEQGSKPLEALRMASPVFTSMTGALTGDLPATSFNHASGGLLLTDNNPNLGKTAGTMTWGGATNCLWFANREIGVAAFCGSSMLPPGEGNSGELMGAFVREVWARVNERSDKP